MKSKLSYMDNMASQEPTLFVRRNVAPRINLVDHARGLGINLKSKTLRNYNSPRRGVVSPRSHTAPLTSRTSKSNPSSVVGYPYNSQYIENIVVPIAASVDEQNANSSMIPRPYSASFLNPKLRPKSANRTRSSLPNMQSSVLNVSPRSSAKSTRTLSTYLEKYNVSSTPLGQAYSHGNQKKWNTSQQASRFETEQLNKARGLTLKRTSEIRPHRIDRMYYMSGSPLQPTPRYQVDDAELESLKSLSRARQESHHYGRGLSSHRGDRYLADIADKELPHQPPPSSLSQNPELHPLVPEGTIVNQEPRDPDLDDDSVTLGPTRPSTAVSAKKGSGDKTEASPEEKAAPAAQAVVSDNLPADEANHQPKEEIQNELTQENNDKKEDSDAHSDKECTEKEPGHNERQGEQEEDLDTTKMDSAIPTDKPVGPEDSTEDKERNVAPPNDKHDDANSDSKADS